MLSLLSRLVSALDRLGVSTEAKIPESALPRRWSKLLLLEPRFRRGGGGGGFIAPIDPVAVLGGEAGDVRVEPRGRDTAGKSTTELPALVVPPAVPALVAPCRRAGGGGGGDLSVAVGGGERMFVSEC